MNIILKNVFIVYNKLLFSIRLNMKRYLSYKQVYRENGADSDSEG